MHADYSIAAAKAGVHVLCEKPMAVTARECQQMIDACEKHGVKLMIAYRLHFEELNLKAIDLIQKGTIGEPKFFNSSFSLTVRPGNIRTQAELGGGTLYVFRGYCFLTVKEAETSSTSSSRCGGFATTNDASATTPRTAAMKKAY